jgi:hypothetical protein
MNSIMTTLIAAPAPKSQFLKDLVQMLMDRIFAYFEGEPPVRTNGTLKLLNDHSEVRTERMTTTGFNEGSVIYHQHCQGVAPSTLAASYCSADIPCSPASRVINQNGH